MGRSHIRVSVVTTLGLLALAAPAARADIFAVADHDTTGSPSNIDIVVADTSGLAASLPAGVNTQADETHPSVTADGTRLVFERQPDPNTTRIIVVDMTNGQQADVINGFDAAQIGPATPSITPDGTGVLVGTSKSTGPVLIDVSAFPSGPYPHTDIAGASGPLDPIATGSARGSLYAFVTEGAGRIAYGRVGGSVVKQTPPAGQLNLNPALASPNGTPTVMFMSGNFFGNADIQFCSPLSPTGACQLASLPGTVNTSADETRPAFTSDGRYVGFLRNSGSHERVFVWDSETQTLLDSSGTDLGVSSPIQTANLSLYEKPVFHLTSLSPRGQVSFNLLSASLVGIIVQRVKGHQKLFGHTVPKLGPARRVPLGSFHRGKGKAHWNLRIAGKRLRPGTYQVTPRALTSKGKVRDLGKPRLLRIRHG